MAGETDLELKKTFLGIDETTSRHLKEVEGIVAANIDPILDAFYAHVSNYPNLLALFGDTDEQRQKGLQRAKAAQIRHWGQLFSGQMDDAYAASARHIGYTHSRIGLEPAWYIGGYLILLNHLHATVSRTFASRLRPLQAQARASEVMGAVSKAVMLDMDIAISTYLADIRKAHNNRLAQDFDTSVRTIVDAISTSIATLGAGAGALAGAVALTRDQAASSAKAAEDASANTQSVAAAAEELASSSSEISRQVERANAIAQGAVEEATRVNAVVSGLSSAAQGIGQIVELIQAVAAQTRLLALNATIEAARAGDAGKGFAVVASEVNGLAAQTGHATDDIARQIETIRHASAETARAIDGISATIGQISAIFSAIAAAVHQQLSTTGEITRSVQGAADETAQIAVNMTDVIAAADKAALSGAQVETISGTLASEAGNLERKAAAFLSSLGEA